MKSNIIFIHIPKTGGTTINAAMNQTYWQTEPGFNYRHILPQSKVSNSGDIFDPENATKYSHFDIFMMLRHPVDRAISEYYFMRERMDFIKMIVPQPKSLKEFVSNKQTHNYVVSFLTGGKIYSKRRPNLNDLERIKEAIVSIPIHVGFFEHFSESLNYFSNHIGIEWKKKIVAKRMTFVRPKVEEISDELRQQIITNNSLDLELYNFCYEIFSKEKTSSGFGKIKFDLSKYNHVLQYMANYPFIGFCMENRKFINQNLDFFKKLSIYLIDEKKINDGYELTKIWNASFVSFIEKSFPDTDFARIVIEESNREKDPLKKTCNMAKAIDLYLKKNEKGNSKYYKSISFDERLVVIPQKSIFKIIGGLWG